MEDMSFVEALREHWPAGVATAVGLFTALTTYLIRRRTVRKDALASAVDGYQKLCADLRADLQTVRDLLKQAQDHLESAERRIICLETENAQLKARLAALEEQLAELSTRKSPRRKRTPAGTTT